MRSKSKLTGFGVALGTAAGIVVGVMAGHMAVWLAIGVAIGIGIGSTVQRKTSDCPHCAELRRGHETVQQERS
ncbi:MAG TPA: hypothetical protein VFO39_03630 [Candidatus Sulfotelmatobacter sp.]|nr:hypothetical protein [Candidatus Sulfotelmatobacter sp.]